MRYRRFIPLISALIAFTLIAVAQQNQQTQPSITQAPGRTPSDALTLAMSNHFEIASSQAALSKHVADNVKQFAQRMVSDHTKNQQQLQEMAQRMKVALPTDEGVANRLRILSLEPLNGRDLERAYLRAQVDGHESTALFLETALRLIEQGQGSGNQNATNQNAANQGQGGAGGAQAGQGNTQGNAAQANAAQDMAQLRQFLQTTLATVRQHLQMATQLYQSVSK